MFSVLTSDQLSEAISQPRAQHSMQIPQQMVILELGISKAH